MVKASEVERMKDNQREEGRWARDWKISCKM